jgi:hypothetical protein
MGIDAKHPEFEARLPGWKITRDCYAGEEAIKEEGEEYLPATKGMLIDGMGLKEIGREMYEAYKLRAVWHDLFKEGVEVYIGLLHLKKPVIEVPDAMKSMLDKATLEGEGLEALLQKINEQQLITGRVGLLVDFPETPSIDSTLPYIATYVAESIMNWDSSSSSAQNSNVNLIVLNESLPVRDAEFNWTIRTIYRVLSLGDPASNDSTGTYMAGVFRSDGEAAPSFDAALMSAPNFKGKTLSEIPFTFINTKDLLPATDAPPLMGVAQICLAMYRGEADYRQNLFMQGQDTLIIIGAIHKKDAAEDPDAPLRTGAGTRVHIDTGGDAKYIGVQSSGLEEQRLAISNDRQRAEVRAGQLINARVGDKESGEALKTRLAAQTATLNQIAKTGAKGLENTLKLIARWIGADESKVKVEPNLEFASFSLTGQDLNQLMEAKHKKLPLSMQSIHETLVARGYTKVTYDVEQERMAGEEELPNPLEKPEPVKPTPAA